MAVKQLQSKIMQPACESPLLGSNKGALWFAASIIVLFIYRIALMMYLPLADSTEARYGLIARFTVTNGFWLMHHIDQATPFFAKPPLSTWAAAASMTLFGISPFAARLPSLLASGIALFIGWQFAKELGVRHRWMVIVAAMTSPLFFISAGAVMTDAIQTAVVVAALFSAWKTIAPCARQTQALWWRLAFWAMFGLGGLSKGLATWALIGLPLAAYGLADKRFGQLVKQLFSWSGILLSALIAVPWYVLAEQHYPSFMRYFFVGEHFSRFLVPGWSGDRYGTAHHEPIGMIWLFWTAAVLPWIGVFAVELWRFARKTHHEVEPLERFLWCATLAPLLFFTFTRNIIWTYGLTALIPFSVLVARWLERKSDAARRSIGFVMVLFSIGSVLAAPLIYRTVTSKSDRDLIDAFSKIAAPNAQLIYTIKPSYSANFYAQERLRYEPEASLVSGKGERFIVIDNASLRQGENALPSNAILFSNDKHTLIRVQ